MPFHSMETKIILIQSRKIIVVENNKSGQFARYLHGETGISADGHIDNGGKLSHIITTSLPINSKEYILEIK